MFILNSYLLKMHVMTPEEIEYMENSKSIKKNHMAVEPEKPINNDYKQNTINKETSFTKGSNTLIPKDSKKMVKSNTLLN